MKAKHMMPGKRRKPDHGAGREKSPSARYMREQARDKEMLKDMRGLKKGC